MSIENKNELFEHKAKSIAQLKANYSSRIAKERNGFASFEAFLNWYQKEAKVCYYCGLTEAESQELVFKGLVKSNRFPQDGKTGRGQGRGVWLEVDRLKPKGQYSDENCVLCCYFCNNDKSDVFHGDDYKQFHQNRLQYLKNLLANNR